LSKNVKKNNAGKYILHVLSPGKIVSDARYSLPVTKIKHKLFKNSES